MFPFLSEPTATISPLGLLNLNPARSPASRRVSVLSLIISHLASKFLVLLTMVSHAMILLLLLTIFSSLEHFPVSPFEYEVGDASGWVVPPENDSRIYNDWASENRFRIGDHIRFRYRKDSVMEVEEGDYKKCNSTHPNFFSNTGNTVFNLDHAGAFYFMSGVSGHCQRGQKMIVKVMAPDHSSSHATTTPSSASRNAASALGGPPFSLLLVAQFVLSFLASNLF